MHRPISVKRDARINKQKFHIEHRRSAATKTDGTEGSAMDCTKLGARTAITEEDHRTSDKHTVVETILHPMTVYRNTGCGQDGLTIISETEFAGRVSAVDAVRLMNRESEYRQSHAKNVAELEAAHNRLGLQEPFAPYCFYGSGSLRFMNHPGWRGRYFRQLRDLIETGLRQTQRTLYVITPFIDRLLRPLRYNQNDESTWTLLESDYRMLLEWMESHSKHRAKDVVFVLLHDGTPVEIRGVESALGMHNRGKMGGKPPKIKKTRMDKNMRDYLRMVTVFLLEKGRSVQKIQQIFEKRGASVTIRAIQRWAKAAGFARLPGRPRTVATRLR